MYTNKPSLVCSVILKGLEFNSKDSLVELPPASNAFVDSEIFVVEDSNVDVVSGVMLPACMGFIGFKGLKLKLAANLGKEGFQFSPKSLNKIKTNLLLLL